MCVLPTSLACGKKEKKRIHYANKKTLPAQEMRQRATKYCCWEIMLIVWTVYASLSATTPTPLNSLSFTSDGSRPHRLAPTTVVFAAHCFCLDVSSSNAARAQYYKHAKLLFKCFGLCFEASRNSELPVIIKLFSDSFLCTIYTRI
jgi:hypothetical protein